MKEERHASPVRFLVRRTVIAAVLCTLALALVPTAFGQPGTRSRGCGCEYGPRPDDWGVDPRSAPRSTPIRAARSAPSSAVLTSVLRTGIRVGGDAFIGAAVVGFAVMCVALGCVTLVRHDGRLRSA